MYVPREELMRAALEQARKAYGFGDYAIGAVVAKDDKIVSAGANRIKLDADPTQHAEIVAIREAARILGVRHLTGHVLYTTHEPCPMCATAAIWARLGGIVSGARMEDMIAYRADNGNDDWSWRTIAIPAQAVLAQGDPQLFLIEGFMRNECRMLFHTNTIR